jgi:hypothetical protein
VHNLKRTLFFILICSLVGLILYAIIPAQGIHTKLNFMGVPAIAQPYFADINAVLGGIECFKAGFDPYNPDACLAYDARWAYTPTWFLLSPLPISRSWTLAIGIIQLLVFILSIAYFIRNTPYKRWIWAVLLLLSPALLFAFERGNADILMCILLFWAVYVKADQPILSLALIALAASLKVYPIVALLIFLPDLKDKTLRWYILGTGLAFLAFVVYYFKEFQQIQALSPKFVAISFGWVVFQLHAAEMGFPLISSFIFGGGILGGAVILFFSLKSKPITYKESFPDQLFLAGSAVYLFNYILGFQVDYRLVLLSMLLPKLLSDPKGLKLKHLYLLVLMFVMTWGNLGSMWVNYSDYQMPITMGVYRAHPMLTFIEESTHFIFALLMLKEILHFVKSMIDMSVEL